MSTEASTSRSGLLLVLLVPLLSIVAALLVLAFGPKTLVFCNGADALGQIYLAVAERTIGVVHVDGGAGRYRSCYAPTVSSWRVAFGLLVGGPLLLWVWLLRRGRRASDPSR